jgi:hypothetical protein
MLAIGLLALVLVTFSAQQQVRADEPVVLTEQEILAQFIGNTATGIDEGTRWSEYYQPNGTIKGRWSNDPYQGKWTVSGSEMCFDYAGSADDGCWTMSVKGDEITYYKKGKHDGTGKLLKGNPKNF